MAQTVVAPKSETMVVPSGTPVSLHIEDIIPSRNNPRHLFDRAQLDSLKKNICEHGVLVPLTVYRPKGQKKYSILDGERRYRCCVELEEEGRHIPIPAIDIPANVVAPPSKIAGILYMFSIHNFREQWELMPTALALKTVIETLKESDPIAINRFTGLSTPQIERCKILLTYPEKYQQMSLDVDPKTRIPSNFWIELYPVLALAEAELPQLIQKHSRNGVIDLLVEKYRARRIKSVIHFRRIMEAYEVAEEQRTKVIERLKAFIENVDLETRNTFDEFVVDQRRIRSAIDACFEFIRELRRLKIDYTLDRDELRRALEEVKQFAEESIAKLEGTDPSAENK
jgi:ParB family transcriptional regulator, chromosome partitioning protein